MTYANKPLPATEAQIKKLMRDELKNSNYFLEPQTGETNITELAEFACEHFNGYEGDDVPDEYYDFAFEVSPYNQS